VFVRGSDRKHAPPRVRGLGSICAGNGWGGFCAISSGYRLIDTAKAYRNEVQVGEGLRDSGQDRSELFITTKLIMNNYGYDSALRAFDESLQKLGLEYLDLYLLHWPTRSWDATVQSWKALERLLAEGRVKSIGVCNFLEDHIDKLMSETSVVPSVNQIEIHPYFTQKVLIAKNKSLGIVTQGWSPIGGLKTTVTGMPTAGKETH